jgi:predicted ATPase/class 3 adenylate cyclase
MREFPTGTVTFLFTDIEGSTKLLHELGDAYADALAEHRRVLRKAFARHGGVEVDTQGDAFFVAFARASDALAAAREAQDALSAGRIRVRMGVHTGEPLVTDEGYVGIDVHRAARIAAVAHGRQVVLSDRTRQVADGAATLVDLGRHRLKDLAEPERLYQLGEETFPPLRSLNATNLPVQPEPLVGRERELGEVHTLLEEARLVTLTGAGGSGKTRLALHVAAELVDDFKDGVFWVSLAAVTDPTLVLPAAASVVGASDDLGEFVGEKRLLLLLDNLEQVLGCATEIADLLRRCPNLRLLATSRAPLRINGEQQYEVPPLPRSDAAELFKQRARRVTPEFVPDEYVPEICRRLDGLPLALELAAARVKLLTTNQILDRLGRSIDIIGGGARDLPSRQQTLRATIEWSYQLLDEPEKQLFERLAVFAGSFELEAAETVCFAMLDTLEGLVDKSLLRRVENGRFFMLETIGEYARELLGASDDAAALRESHRLFFLELAETEGQRVHGPDARVALDRLEADHANLQLAVRTAFDDGAGETGLRLAAALHPFWYLHGHYSVGRILSEEALAAAPRAPASLRVKGLAAATEFTLMQGHLARARTLLEERLALCERSETDHIASTLTFFGHLAFLEGDLAESERRYAQALAREREAPSADPWCDRATALSNLGWAQLSLRRFDEAEHTLQEGLAVATSLGDDVSRARLLNNLARVALGRGDDDRARRLAMQSLELLKGLKDEHAIAECFDIVACLAARGGACEPAAALAGARDALREQLGVDPEAEAVPDDGLLAALSAQLGATWTAAWERGRSMSIDEAIRYGLAASGQPPET